MRVLRRTLKWFGRILGLLLILIIIAGLILRLLTPEPQPQGDLVDIGDFKLHINAEGQKRNKPTIVIEGGNGMAGLYYHWLNEGLRDSMRVVRYDRAGIGYSEASNTPRDPETIAQELHTLLKKAGEEPPYIMVGHSLGGPYIRLFAELYPNEVVGMFLLDTTHPDRAARIPSIPKKSSFKFKSMVWMYKFQGLLGDLGIMMLFDKIMGPVLPRQMEGLPDEINKRTEDFLSDGKYLRTMGKEFELYHTTLERTGKKNDFGSLPIRVFTSAIGNIPEKVYQDYLERGIDLRETQIKSMKMQEELLNLSTNSKITVLEGNHVSIFTKKENADKICKEIITLAKELKN